VKVRGGSGPRESIPGLVEEFQAIWEEVRGVARAIDDLQEEFWDQSKVLVQAVLAIRKEIWDIWFRQTEEEEDAGETVAHWLIPL
jgi:hypothetical protein